MNRNNKLLTALLGATLLLGACQKEEACDGSLSKTFEATDFSRITAGSAIHLSIRKGNNFSIEADGCRRDIEDLRMQVKQGNTLEIDFDRNRIRRDAVYIDITLPHLSALNLSGAAQGQVSGFAAGSSNLRVVLSGASKAHIQGTTAQTQVELSGGSQLNTSGQTEKLYGTLSGGSELSAFHTSAREVDLSASGGAQAFVKTDHVLRAEASGGARIVYRGAPRVKETTTSGGGQVVPE